MELFKLFGSIAVNNSEANDQISETTGKAESLGSTLTSGIGTAAKWGAAMVGGTTAAVGGMVKFAESSASTADHIDKMSQKIGLSRQAYQELDFICSQSGTSVDGLQAGMKTLTAQMDGAISGTESAIANFEKLGVSVTNADGSMRNQEDVLFDTLSALQSVENQTEKSRIATELFGRSGTELMPLLNGASGSIEEMKQQASDLGLVLSDEVIDNGVNLTDSLDQTKRAFGSLVTQLGGALMPMVEKASDYIQKALPRIQQMIGRLEPILTQTFDSLLPTLMDLCEQIFPILMDLIEQLLPPLTEIIQAILPVIVEILAQVLPMFVEVTQAILPVILELTEMLLPPLMQLIEGIMPILLSVIEMLLPLLDPLMQLLIPILDLTIQLLPPLIQLANVIIPLLVMVITTIVGTLATMLKPLVEWFSNFLGGTLTSVLNALKTTIEVVAVAFVLAWQGIQIMWEVASEFFGEIWSAIKGVFEPVFEFFSETFGAAYNSIVEFFSPITEFFSGIWSSIKEIFNNVGGAVAEAIEGTVSKAINTVLSTAVQIINGFISAINSAIGVINDIPGVHISKLSKLDVPEMAKGGVLEKGQVGLLEGNGAEAVVPLENNKKWIHALAEDMNAEFGGIGSKDVQDKLNRVIDLLERILGMKIYLNNDVLVGELAPAMDTALGTIYEGKERGERSTW